MATLYKPRHVILVGKTGNGKSATGNTILGKDVHPFKNENSSNAVTLACQKEEAFRTDDQIKYVVVDTPGLFDTASKFAERALEIQQAAIQFCQKPHAFLIILRADARYSEEDARTIDVLRITFGQQFLDHAIIVFTRGSEFDSHEKLDAFMQKNEKLMTLKHACGDRVAMVENNVKICALFRDNLLKSLFIKIERMSYGGQRYYINKSLPIHNECLKRHLEKEHGETTMKEQLTGLLSSVDDELRYERRRSNISKGVKVAGGAAATAVSVAAMAGAATVAAGPVAVAAAAGTAAVAAGTVLYNTLS